VKIESTSKAPACAKCHSEKVTRKEGFEHDQDKREIRVTNELTCADCGYVKAQVRTRNY
jgi:hypothetical protein